MKGLKEFRNLMFCEVTTKNFLQEALLDVIIGIFVPNDSFYKQLHNKFIQNRYKNKKIQNACLRDPGSFTHLSSWQSAF